MQGTEEDIGMLQGPQQDFKQAIVARILGFRKVAGREKKQLVGVTVFRKNAQILLGSRGSKCGSSSPSQRAINVVSKAFPHPVGHWFQFLGSYGNISPQLLNHLTHPGNPYMHYLQLGAMG